MPLQHAEKFGVAQSLVSRSTFDVARSRRGDFVTCDSKPTSRFGWGPKDRRKKRKDREKSFGNKKRQRKHGETE